MACSGDRRSQRDEGCHPSFYAFSFQKNWVAHPHADDVRRVLLRDLSSTPIAVPPVPNRDDTPNRRSALQCSVGDDHSS